MASEEDPFEKTRMTLGEHLSELRRRLIRSAIALFIAFALGWCVYEEATDFLKEPMKWALAKINSEQVEKYEAELQKHPDLPRSTYFESDDPTRVKLRPELTVSPRLVQGEIGEGFAVALQVSTFVSLVLAAPFVLWELWGFIGAGLYVHERRAILKYFPISIGLFLAGAVFGYLVLARYAFYFLCKVYPPEEVQTLLSLGSYLSLLTSLTLILGGVFQIPVLIYAVVRMGLVSRDFFVKYRRHFIVVTFIVAGILTPPDPYTQSMVAIPMCLLYEAGLFWTRFIKKVEPRF
jgi:Tat protein translocase TatC